MYLLDSTWLPFSNLMLKHVYNVLLICSDYDRFMLEEDGRVEEELYKEYTTLGLSNPPKITHVNNEHDALRAIEELSFDLVITMLDFKTERVEALAKSIKEIKPDLPIITLFPSPDHRKAKELKGENCPYIDYLFCWQGNPSIFLAMIKLVEDKMNIDHDTHEADVQVIILVENSVRFISTYLPQMYTCLIHQNRTAILEALNEWGKTLRMRGRPKIVLARTYEEAIDLYTRYRSNVLGVITDVNYPSKEGNERSGLRLAKAIKKDNPECPVLIQSSDKDLKAAAQELDADFIWKHSDTLLASLENHFIKYYNFGPFIFIDPATGNEITRADTMKEVQNTLKTLPVESFVYHCKRNDFSKWMRAQSLYYFASKIKHIKLTEDKRPEVLQEELYEIIKQYRDERTRGSIAEFSAITYDETLFFSRIGKGSLGGKGRGLAFIAMEMKANGLQEKYKEVYLSIPRTVVITTELFDSFLLINGLDNLSFVNQSDEEILKLFLSSRLPLELETALLQILNVITTPISIRSSSLLEDSHFQPFAGVYQTSMIPNMGTKEERLKELSDAIKTVWASTYFDCAKEYLKMTNHSLEEEKMAVIIQKVTGSLHDNYWFPNISGVARSLNYYPTSGQKTEDGVGMLALGFGKIIVDGATGYRFCPAKPKKPSNSLVSEASSQESFFAMDVTKGFRPLEDSDNLIELPLQTIEKWPSAGMGICSTIDEETGMLSESRRAKGSKLITFNGILKYDTLPLAPIIDDVLKLGIEAMSEPVEIEFAVNTERDPLKPDFSILQIRPISSTSDYNEVKIEDEDKEKALIWSEKIMGNGIIEDISDVITIKPEAFKAAEMQDMASELEVMNKNSESQYLLIAAGRLGSSDRWLGIPCTWSQISKARVIVETGLDEIQAEPSEGSHFFQNMTSLGCLYLTINPAFGDGIWKHEEFKNMEIVEETKHFLHLRAEKPLIIKADGLNSKAVIRKGDEE